MDLRFYLSVFLRQAHWFVLAAIFGAGAGAVIAYALPTVYVAQARLVVESEQIPDELASSTVQTQATEQLQIIQQRILTRDILVEMANRLGIYAARRDQGKPMPGGDEVVEDLRRRITIQISGASPTQRRGEAYATIVTVSFRAPTGALAAAVTNEVVTLILKEDVAMRTGVARQTLEFFEQEVARLDKELAQKAAALLDFKQKNLTALPEGGDFRQSRLAAAQAELQDLEAADTALRDERARLIRRLEAARAANGQKGTSAAQDQQVAELDARAEALTSRKTALQAEVAALSAAIAATPGNAVTLEALQRDYAAVQDQYAQALDSKAKAETGDTIEALSKGQRISVIEQAVVPRAPTSPNRPLVAIGGLIFGMILGLCIVAGREVMKPGIRRPADLVNGLGITPFATLPYLTLPGENRKPRIIWGTLLGGLILLGIGILLVHFLYMPLGALIGSLRGAS